MMHYNTDDNLRFGKLIPLALACKRKKKGGKISAQQKKI